MVSLNVLKLKDPMMHFTIQFNEETSTMIFSVEALHDKLPELW